jgi:beta-barrel assembly-enhancing protease
MPFNDGSRPRIPIRLIIGLVVAVITLVSYYGKGSLNPVTGQKQRIGISPQQEVALGLQSAAEMARQFGGLDSNGLDQSTVDRVGQLLFAGIPQEAFDYPYDFHLLADAKTVNAFALPGGQIFITRALYDRLQTEGQLAGVLGHEIGHVLGRHSAQQMAKAELLQGLVGAATVAASDTTMGARSAQVASGMVANMLQLKYGRDDELEADLIGLRLMYSAGYDPRSLIGVMKILEQASGGSGRDRPDFMSTHPSPGNRIARIEGILQQSFPQGVPGGLKP